MPCAMLTGVSWRLAATVGNLRAVGRQFWRWRYSGHQLEEEEKKLGFPSGGIIANKPTGSAIQELEINYRQH